MGEATALSVCADQGNSKISPINGEPDSRRFLHNDIRLRSPFGLPLEKLYLLLRGSGE